MREWINNLNWFAIHAKRFRENIAAATIRRLGLEVFLPMVRVERPEQTVIKVDSKPLFPGYFFARFNPVVSLAAVESAFGVLYVVKAGTFPTAVDDHLIEEIQSRIQPDGLVHFQRGELKPGDRVSIQQGPFAGMIGRVEAELDDRKRVAILLESLWNARALIEKRWVQAEAA
jgi:transcriptional antiterminator RfaH